MGMMRMRTGMMRMRTGMRNRMRMRNRYEDEE